MISREYNMLKIKLLILFCGLIVSLSATPVWENRYRTTGDNSGSSRCWTKENHTGSCLALNRVRNRAVYARNAEEVLLRFFDTLGDCRGHLLGLSVADTDHAVTVAHHDEREKAAGVVMLRPASPGTGVIAGASVRAILEMLGIQDVVAKSLGSQNPYNMIRATIDGLTLSQSPRQVASRRGKKVADILPKRDDAPADAAETVEA